jgi:hypothetical protein
MTTSNDLEAKRAIARRLFEALCARHPEKYVALIQPGDTAGTKPTLPLIEHSEVVSVQPQ